MNIQTENYYTSQHKDDEAANVYRVVRCVQEWVNAFPRDVLREAIIFNLTRDEAEATSRMFNKSFDKGSIVDSVKARIDFLTDNETNQSTAERCDLPAPLVF